MRFGTRQLNGERTRQSALQTRTQWTSFTPRHGPFLLCDLHHVPYESLLNDDTTFKSPEELSRILAVHVPDPTQPIISYCRLSHRATLAAFAMTELLGYTNVRVYDGSWTEWGSIVGVPIER